MTGTITERLKTRDPIPLDRVGDAVALKAETLNITTKAALDEIGIFITTFYRVSGGKANLSSLQKIVNWLDVPVIVSPNEHEKS